MNDLSERLEVALGSLLESEKRVAELEAWKEAATQSATAWQPVLEWAAKNGCLVGKDIPHFVVAKLASNHADNVEKVKAALCEDGEKGDLGLLVYHRRQLRCARRHAKLRLVERLLRRQDK